MKNISIALTLGILKFCIICVHIRNISAQQEEAEVDYTMTK